MTAVPPSGGGASACDDAFLPRRQRNIRGAILSSKASFTYDKNTSPFRSSSYLLSDGATPESPTARPAGRHRKRNFMADYADSMEGGSVRALSNGSPSPAPRQISNATSSGIRWGPSSERLPYRPTPQSQFHFQAPAPMNNSLGQIVENNQEPDANPTSETSAMAFARLAQMQRAQQEANRRHASGLGLDHSRCDDPPAKRRKGMTETLVEGAVSAAIFTGAAAVTAWSLWSKWGREGDNDDNEDGNQVMMSRDSSREHLPPGGLEEPPPPYLDRGRVSHEEKLSHGSSSPSSSTRRSSFLPAKQTRVFVSSSRRRPAFERHRVVKSSSSKSSTPSKPPYKSSGDGSMDPIAPAASSRRHFDEGLEEGMEDVDDSFQRMQSQMALLIEEGNRALQSTHQFEDGDDFEAVKQDRPGRMHYPTPATHQDSATSFDTFVLGPSHPRPYGMSNTTSASSAAHSSFHHFTQGDRP